jgi:uncharacterized protein (TIGR02996 family)
MTTPALRRAWAEWCAFADGLDLSDGAPGGAALHGRLFRLCGSHPLRAAELEAAREGVRAAFGPWLGGKASRPAGDLERLRRAMTACEPGWRALLALTARRTDWAEVERVARSAGLAWPEGRFWTSPLHVERRRFDLLRALRGRDHAAALSLLDALLLINNHPHGGPLLDWVRGTTFLTRPAEALQAAALLRDAAAAGALRQEWLVPLGWQTLPELLLRLCQDVCLCLLIRLNEPLPTAGRAPKRRRPAARLAPYRRVAPEPLPVEPYFRAIRGSEAFLKAVAEEPLEDVHRLAFADWLEEQGHAERARFIRLQCERERLPDHPLARRRLAEPIAALFKAHGAAWLAGLPRYSDRRPFEEGCFRRGLLEHLSLGDPPYPEELARLLPFVDLRSVETEFYGSSCPEDQAGARAFVRRPWAAGLVSLEVDTSFHEEDFAALGGAPALSGVVHLGLTGGWVRDDGVRALAESFRLPALVSLALDGRAVQGLTAGGLLRNIRKLRLVGGRSSSMGPPGVRSLAACPAAANLEHLDLSDSYAGTAGAESLASSPFLANLTTLVLNNCRIRDRGAEALASSPFLKRLTCLDLRGAELTDEGVRALAGSANLAGLTVLDLGENPYFREAGLQALASSPHLGGLRALSLAGGVVTPEGVRALAESPSLANLDTLDLSETQLDEPSARALAASPHLKNLAALDLKHNALPPPAQAALRKRWPFISL